MFKTGKRELKQELDAELKAARDRLLEDPKILRRKVRRVSALGDQHQPALDLYTLAAGHRFNWTPEDWTAVLEKLDNNDLTVREYIDGLDRSA